MSGEPGWGNGSITLKMMKQNGEFLPGNITKNMGYVCMIEFQLCVKNFDAFQSSVVTCNLLLRCVSIAELIDARVVAVN